MAADPKAESSLQDEGADVPRVVRGKHNEKPMDFVWI